jgi:hypothetical protein
MTISGFVEYVKQIWKNKPDRTTPITAAALTHIEDGIKGNSDAINKIAQAVVDNIVNDPQKIASMAALYAVNESVKKNATAIETVNNNLSKCLQYIHSETDVFDFNDPKTPAGYHRLGAAASYKNAPSGLDGVNFCTVEVVRPTISDTLAMTIYPYKKGINPPVWYKSGGSNEWPTLPWNVYATKSDLAWNPVSISELNTNAEIPDGGLNNGANIYVSCGRLHILSLSLNLSSDINGNLFKVGTGHIPVRSARIICTAKSGNVTAMPYLDSNGYVITAGTIPAGQVKLLGIYMTA